MKPEGGVASTFFQVVQNHGGRTTNRHVADTTYLLEVFNETKCLKQVLLKMNKARILLRSLKTDH